MCAMFCGIQCVESVWHGKIKTLSTTNVKHILHSLALALSCACVNFRTSSSKWSSFNEEHIMEIISLYEWVFVLLSKKWFWQSECAKLPRKHRRRHRQWDSIEWAWASSLCCLWCARYMENTVFFVLKKVALTVHHHENMFDAIFCCCCCFCDLFYILMNFVSFNSWLKVWRWYVFSINFKQWREFSFSFSFVPSPDLKCVCERVWDVFLEYSGSMSLVVMCMWRSQIFELDSETVLMMVRPSSS